MKWKQAIEHYQNYLRIERGLSENSNLKIIPSTFKNWFIGWKKMRCQFHLQKLPK
jgi:hypothetical protein